MDPQQPTPAPAPGAENPYHFILNPATPPKPPRMSFLRSGSLTARLAVLIGGAVLLMIVMGIGAKVLLGGHSNLGELVLLTENQAEIVRVSQQSSGTVNPAVLGAAANTQVSVASQQQTILDFLSQHGRKVGDKELALGTNRATDQQLTAARESGSLDTVFTQIMRNSLTAYAAKIKTAYGNTVNTTERALLSDDYDQVQLLLKQWPQQ